MNFLAHAVLSLKEPETLVGNMIADFVKGKIALENYPPMIRAGIMLHRQIDSFTDAHPATKRASLFFREDYHLYAGPIVDTLYDHFLANDPIHFPTEQSLLKFSGEVYGVLEQYHSLMPDGFLKIFPSMQQHNWLFNYRNLGGIKRCLRGLQHRATQMPDATKAYQLWIANYHQLTQCYYELTDDVFPFVKNRLA